MANHSVSRLHSAPDLTLDAMFEGYDDTVPKYVDILVMEEEDATLSVDERAAKRLRVRGYAASYLMNRPIRLQSATLRGPLDGWKNPWASKRSASLRPQRAKAAVELLREPNNCTSPSVRKMAARNSLGPVPRLPSPSAGTAVELCSGGEHSAAMVPRITERTVDSTVIDLPSSPDRQLLAESRNVPAPAPGNPQSPHAGLELGPEPASPVDRVGKTHVDATEIVGTDHFCQINTCTPQPTDADTDVIWDQEQTPSKIMLPPFVPSQKKSSARLPQQAPNPGVARLQQRRRLSFNTTPVTRPHSRGVMNASNDHVLAQKEHDIGEHDAEAEPRNAYDDLSTQAALIHAQASFKNILTPSQPHSNSPGHGHSTIDPPHTSPSGLPAITPFRAFTSLTGNEENEIISTQALFDDARHLTFSTVKKPMLARPPQRRISEAFRISKTNSQPASSAPKSSPGKPLLRPTTADSLFETLDVDAALEDMSGFLDVSDLPEETLKGTAKTDSQVTQGSGREKRSSIKKNPDSKI